MFGRPNFQAYIGITLSSNATRLLVRYGHPHAQGYAHVELDSRTVDRVFGDDHIFETEVSDGEELRSLRRCTS